MNVVAYEESFGEVSFPEGFEITLKGLPIEEQALHYRTTCYSKYSKTGWSERVYEGSAAMLHKDGSLLQGTSFHKCDKTHYNAA